MSTWGVEKIKTTMYGEIMTYADGTFLAVSRPWGLYRGGKVMCADGKLRALKRIAPMADTFFSVPAAVKVNGRTVAGYVTIKDRNLDEPGPSKPRVVVEFHAYTYRKNHALIKKEKE